MINRKILTVAKILRQRMTKAEEILWDELKGNKVGRKFRRQMPFVFGAYKYVADFYCPQNKLIIELDGEVHEDLEIKDYDEFREDIFKEMGYEILRFKNEEITNSLDKVINKISKFIK